MNKPQPTTVLREMLREQLCCLGRIVARHHVPDDVVWEITKGFDLIYQRARCQIDASPDKSKQPSSPHRLEPHPGFTYLLDKNLITNLLPRHVRLSKDDKELQVQCRADHNSS